MNVPNKKEKMRPDPKIKLLTPGEIEAYNERVERSLGSVKKKVKLRSLMVDLYIMVSAERGGLNHSN